LLRQPRHVATKSYRLGKTWLQLQLPDMARSVHVISAMEMSKLTGDSALERAVVRSEAFLRSAPKPVTFGVLASALALAFVVRRANKRRRRLNGERGDTVLGVIVKSSLSAAIATIPKVYFLRLAKSALHHDPAPGMAADSRMRPTIPEPRRYI
jgi:hypothetical protein